MSYDTPQIIFWNAAKASSLGPKCTVPTSKRLRNQQRMLATDTPTTLLAVAMTHYELPGLGLDGRNVDLVQIDAPFRSYLTSARASHIGNPVRDDVRHGKSEVGVQVHDPDVPDGCRR